MPGDDLVRIEPWRPPTVHHIGKQLSALHIKQFRDGGDMEVKPTIVHQADRFLVEKTTGPRVFDNMDVSSSFNRLNIFAMNRDGTVDRVKKLPEAANPPALEIREGASLNED